MSLSRLVDMAHMRWRIDHDYRDLKQEIGLGHYEWQNVGHQDGS